MTLAAGQRIANRFSVLRRVGEGGMGVVCEVTDAKFPGERRALKVLREGREGDAGARALFAREVTAAASIQSDHVVKVLDYDLEGATPWMLMELLEGETLDAAVARRGALPWDEARRLAMELGHALGAAHRAGVLHLDLKPSNVFLARLADAYGTTRLKVLDFGLSRQIVEGRSHVLQSRAMGTEAWMSPEQFNKKSALRQSADVWPLGLIAFWMLTARHYWLSIDDQGDVEDVSQLLGEVVTGAVVPASERARERRAERALPAGFDAWFARCVAKAPGDRWTDGATASRELDAVLARASVTPVPETPAPPPPPPRAPTREAPHPPQAPAGFTAPVRGATHQVASSPSPPAPVAVATPSDRSRPRRLLAVGGAGLAVLVFAGVWASMGPSRDAPLPRGDGGATPVASRPDATAVAQPTAPSCPPDMALIPAGEFQMGSPPGEGEDDERPRHRVVFRAPFCMDRTEVSVAAYRACVTTGACTAPNAFRDARGDDNSFCNWDRPGAEEHPVNCVDWRQAKAFCEWSGHDGGARRLPREAEWEYAARGRDGRTWPWGNDGLDGTHANLCGDECVAYAREHGFRDWSQIRGWRDGHGATAPVTAFPLGATPEGLLNMAGNVWEWVEDVYASDAYAHHDAAGFFAREATGTSQSTELRVLRGGGWVINDASRARAADRYRNAPSIRVSDLGLRCARGAR